MADNLQEHLRAAESLLEQAEEAYDVPASEHDHDERWRAETRDLARLHFQAAALYFQIEDHREGGGPR